MADSSIRVVYGAVCSPESLISGCAAFEESARALSALRVLARRAGDPHPITRMPDEILSLIERATIKLGSRSARKRIDKLVGARETIRWRSVR